MKAYTDSKHGYKIDLPDDWIVDNYKPPFIAGLFFLLFYGGPLKKGMAFVRGSDETLETLNVSVETMPPGPGVSPELTQQTFIEYARQSGYTISNFGRIFVRGKEQPWVRYQIAENVWSKKYMIVLNGIGYAITTCFKNNDFPFEKEAEWDAIACSLRLL
jgi:hypothetical protein